MCILLVISFCETLGKTRLCIFGGMHLLREDWMGTFYFMSTDRYTHSFLALKLFGME